MSAIEPYLERGRVALKKNPTVEELAKALIDPVDTDEKKALVPFPPVPKPLVLDEKTKQALQDLAGVFALVQPETRRALTPRERTQVQAELNVIKTVKALMEKREESLKEVVRHHIDVAAEKAGRAFPEDTEEHDATIRDDKGHYILARPQDPERITIPESNEEWSQEFVSGGINVSPVVLEQMVEDGEIDRKVYLAMTEIPQTRVFNEHKALLAAAKPEMRDQVFKAIKKMTSVRPPRTSLFTNRKKKD